MQLLSEEKLPANPGAYPGAGHHLRITVGYGIEKVETALARISNVVSELAIAAS